MQLAYQPLHQAQQGKLAIMHKAHRSSGVELALKPALESAVRSVALKSIGSVARVGDTIDHFSERSTRAQAAQEGTILASIGAVTFLVRAGFGHLNKNQELMVWGAAYSAAEVISRMLSHRFDKPHGTTTPDAEPQKLGNPVAELLHALKPLKHSHKNHKTALSTSSLSDSATTSLNEVGFRLHSAEKTAATSNHGANLTRNTMFANRSTANNAFMIPSLTQPATNATPSSTQASQALFVSPLPTSAKALPLTQATNPFMAVS